MKLKKYFIIAAALALVSAASVGTTMAYFTDTKQATGGVTLSLGDSRITPKESVDGMVKHVTVENTGNYDVFIRVKAVYGENYEVVRADGSDEGWSLKDDGYYYYKDVVKAHEEAPVLNLEVKVKDDSQVPDSFNIVIVEEASLAIYDADGNASVDWAKKVMSRSDYDAKFSGTTNTQTTPENTSAESTNTATTTNEGEGEN